MGREARVRYVQPEEDEFVTRRMEYPERARALSKRASLRLVVMIGGQLGDSPTLGAGILFARGKGRLSAVTSNHVVRRGAVVARDLRIRLKDYPDVSLRATVAPQFDAEMDVAVIDIDLTKDPQIDPCLLLMSQLSDGRDLKRGDIVNGVGNPQGLSWGMSVTPELVASAGPDQIVFQSTFLSPGHSGGALLDNAGRIVGMIQRDQPPSGIARRVSAILPKLREWGYIVELYQPRRMESGRDYSYSVLEEAVASGNLALVRSLLGACPDVNRIDFNGASTLHLAATHGRVEVLRELIQRGANVNARMVTYPNVETSDQRFANDLGEGDSALELAASRGHAAIVRVLLESGADPKSRDRDTPGALHEAAMKGHVEVIRLLGRNPDLLNGGAAGRNGQTPLHAAIEAKELGAVRALLELKASPNVRDGSRRTPLYIAVRDGVTEAVKLLLDAGADPNAADDSGRSPLALAKRKDDEEARAIQELLRSRGAK